MEILKNRWVRLAPFLLVLLTFALRVTYFNQYHHFEPGAAFETPIGLRLNIDAKGVGTCGGEFPRHFVEQSRCGYFYLTRPGYFAILFAASRPIVWGYQLAPESIRAKVPVPPEMLPFAAALVTAVFLNIPFAFLTLVGLRLLFRPYFKREEYLWLAQMGYAGAFGTAAYMGDGLAEVFQQCLMVWVPLLFRDWRGYSRGLALGFALTGKEVICTFAGGLVSAYREKKLSWHLLLIPLPILAWFAFLRLGHGVAIRSYSVNDWGYGTWYLKAFTDFPLFQEKLQQVVNGFFFHATLSFLPLIWIGVLAYPFLARRIPFLIHIQLFFALGQTIAMGYMHSRVLYNFLFMPFLFSTVLAFIVWKEGRGWSEKSIVLTGMGAAVLGLLGTMLGTTVFRYAL